MSKNTIKPLADRVLVKPIEAETTTASGLIIPDSAKEKQEEGTVIAIGNGTIFMLFLLLVMHRLSVPTKKRDYKSAAFS